VTKKPYDPGQKWRTLKNLSRAYKNPLGFFIWRYTYGIQHGNSVSYNYLILVYGTYSAASVYGQLLIKWERNKKVNISITIVMQSYINRYQYNRGERDFFPHKGWTDNRLVAGP
jgi:hypothetical protein